LVCQLEYKDNHVSYVGPSHQDMVHPKVADGGDGLQIWRVAMNISNKQSWTANKGSSSSMGVVQGASNSSL